MNHDQASLLKISTIVQFILLQMLQMNTTLFHFSLVSLDHYYSQGRLHQPPYRWYHKFYYKPNDEEIFGCRRYIYNSLILSLSLFLNIFPIIPQFLSLCASHSSSLSLSLSLINLSLTQILSFAQSVTSYRQNDQSLCQIIASIYGHLDV